MPHSTRMGTLAGQPQFTYDDNPAPSGGAGIAPMPFMSGAQALGAQGLQGLGQGPTANEISQNTAAWRGTPGGNLAQNPFANLSTSPAATPSPTFQNNAGYNPSQYADLTTANRMAEMLGGQTAQTQMGPGSPFNVPPQNLINFGEGDPLNAGLLAERYTKYSKAAADAMTAAERAQGQGFTPTFNTPESQYNTNVTGGANFLKAGSSAPGQAPVNRTISSPANPTAPHINPSLGLNPHRNDFMGGVGGPSNPTGPNPQFLAMLPLLMALSGQGGGGLQQILARLRGQGGQSNPLYSKGRSALGYTRWQPNNVMQF